MFRFFSRSLMGRLITLFLLAAIIPLGIVAVLSFYYSESALKNAAFNQLSSIDQVKTNQILTFLTKRLVDLSILSKSSDIHKNFDLLLAYHDAGGGNPNGPFDVNTDEYKAIYEQVDPFFREYLEGYGYHDIYFICKAHGHVMYTAAKEIDLGTNLKIGALRESGLAKVWSRVLEEKRMVMVDFSHYAPSKGPAVFIGAPVYGKDKEVYAVLALQISTREIDAIMQERTGMGETGETYLVGPDFLMRSNSRFEKETTILKKRVDTAAVQRAMEGKKGIDVVDDYRGEKVLSCYEPLNLKKALKTDFEWVIVSEIDAAEAFAPVRSLGWKILWVGLMVLVSACILGYLSAKSIAGPLKEVSGVVKQVADGDLTVATGVVKRADEVGVLMNAFREMVVSLRDQTHEMIEGANTIAASTSELSSTASQLASTSSETSSSVSEVTTTVEEVKQTAELSNEKAALVAQKAEQSYEVSEMGKDASRKTGEGMAMIRDEMAYIADSIMKLSEHMQRIGEIINSVTDIADQSNLLSVNASIEAAKAGEYGKGFAVVAQEVKSLADQSKEATKQVRTILNDIQKATSNAVMATERGSKAVEKGVDLAARSGDTIRTLSESMAESAQAAAQISSSSQQQLVGMDQLVQAMESIKEASMQNVDGARQLEGAIKGLEKLGRGLKGMADRFKV
jgi:methyl-accepting chemotaxis protein